MRNDIAIDLNTLLGTKYKLYVDNNLGQYKDLQKNITIDSQMLEIEKYIVGIFRTSFGEIVALKDLFSTSFSYAIDFLVPHGVDIYTDLKILRQNLNGVLQDRTEYKYFITFSEPYPVGNPVTYNGKQYQTYNLSGNIAATDSSFFGNEYKVYIDDYEITGLLSVSVGMNSNIDSRNVEGKMLPLKKYISLENTRTLMVHCRKDDPFFLYVLNYVEDAETFETNNKEAFVVKRSFNNTEKAYNCLLVQANIEATIGGYMVMAMSFARTVTL